MNFERLAQEILSEQEIKDIDDSWNLLENKKYKLFYDTNKLIIREMISANSYSDFLDFLETEELNRTIFISTWMYTNEKILEIGGYEENIQNRVIPFLTKKINLVNFQNTMTREEVFSDFDGEDNFKVFIRKINTQLLTHGIQFILFFNDYFVQCIYYLVLFDVKMANKIIEDWDDVDIEIVRL